ncbi:hypothetical protein GGQ74_001901 [Desulfobaculum xiamenense]|uniref:Probable membrane transporter protein n=1 Tax=Desulfobaculum xiamenense TaxID=995050 RepID=A0A846QJ14_9BACT|nr:sulfite exporter TauE/SafE family protein [Desulfobaculum xiamenense]NJB68228.1 hypothetical protein [Desulfobaculum xiamenense]
MQFTVSGVDVAVWIPPLTAFAISFFTSMGGMSGAFLLLPFQMSILGFTSPSVSATNQLFNIVAIPSGVMRYAREGRMVWPLTWAVVFGTLPGVLIGAVARVHWLPDPVRFKLFAGLVLLYIGVRMARDLVSNRQNGAERRFRANVRSGAAAGKVDILEASATRIRFAFNGETFTVRTPALVALTFTVGIVGGVYGIGGGAIIAPFFVSILGIPVYVAAAPALMGTFVTSIAAVAFYQLLAILNPTLSIAPDWALGILFGIGGALGMALGARCQKHVPAKAIKLMLCAVIVTTATRYIVAFFL